jgi:hypothetical protein
MRVGLNTVVLILCTILCTGCAQLDVRSGYHLAPTSRNGIAAVGLTASDNIPEFVWHLRRVGTSESIDVVFHTIYNPLMWTNPRGRLAMFELEQGDYEIFDWSEGRLSPTEFFRIPFSVQAGRVTYLGRLHLNLNARMTRFEIKSQNQYSDDYAILRKKIPNLAPESVDQVEPMMQRCAEADCKKPIYGSFGTSIVIPIIVRSR